MPQNELVPELSFPLDEYLLVDDRIQTRRVIAKKSWYLENGGISADAYLLKGPTPKRPYNEPTLSLSPYREVAERYMRRGFGLVWHVAGDVRLGLGFEIKYHPKKSDHLQMFGLQMYGEGFEINKRRNDQAGSLIDIIDEIDPVGWDQQRR